MVVDFNKIFTNIRTIPVKFSTEKNIAATTDVIKKSVKPDETIQYLDYLANLAKFTHSPMIAPKKEYVPRAVSAKVFNQRLSKNVLYFEKDELRQIASLGKDLYDEKVLNLYDILLTKFDYFSSLQYVKFLKGKDGFSQKLNDKFKKYVEDIPDYACVTKIRKNIYELRNFTEYDFTKREQIFDVLSNFNNKSSGPYDDLMNYPKFIKNYIDNSSNLNEKMSKISWLADNIDSEASCWKSAELFKSLMPENIKDEKQIEFVNKLLKNRIEINEDINKVFVDCKPIIKDSQNPDKILTVEDRQVFFDKYIEPFCKLNLKNITIDKNTIKLVDENPQLVENLKSVLNSDLLTIKNPRIEFLNNTINPNQYGYRLSDVPVDDKFTQKFSRDDFFRQYGFLLNNKSKSEEFIFDRTTNKLVEKSTIIIKKDNPVMETKSENLINGNTLEQKINRDDNANILYEKITDKSKQESTFIEYLEDKKCYDVYTIDKNGTKNYLSHGQTDAVTGDFIINSEITSPTGAKTISKYSENPNCFAYDFTINDKDGKTLFTQKIEREKIGENKYKSIRNGKTYEIEMDDDALKVSTSDEPKLLLRVWRDGEPYKTNLYLSTRFSDNKELAKTVAQFPGNEIINLDELIHKINISGETGGSYDFSSKEIKIGTKNLDSIHTLLHELGHAKAKFFTDDDIARLDSVFKKEFETYKEKTFYQDNQTMEHLLGFEGNYLNNIVNIHSETKYEEIIADVNGMIQAPINKAKYMRLIKLQQYFPQTIAEIGRTLEKINNDFNFQP